MKEQYNENFKIHYTIEENSGTVVYPYTCIKINHLMKWPFYQKTIYKVNIITMKIIDHLFKDVEKHHKSDMKIQNNKWDHEQQQKILQKLSHCHISNYITEPY